MSSKRKNNLGDSNNSNRNLDGRRLRTVNEAKALAEYLALKPEMDKKEKEARRQRWQQVIELSEKRESEIRNGSKGKVDGKWVEDKEEAGERARDAVRVAMKSGTVQDNLMTAPIRDISDESAEEGGQSDDENSVKAQRSPTQQLSATSKHVHLRAKPLYGYDDNNEFMSDDSDHESEEGDIRV